MNIEITQKQDRALLTEHAASSYHFTWVGRNEWILALSFLIMGIVLVSKSEPRPTSGYFAITVGVYELIRYPRRKQRWVDKKAKEVKFGKDITFLLQDHSLRITYGETVKEHLYSKMRGCIISDTGLLFKISFLEYYYISFNSIPVGVSITEVQDFLKSKFDSRRIRFRGPSSA